MCIASELGSERGAYRGPAGYSVRVDTERWQQLKAAGAKVKGHEQTACHQQCPEEEKTVLAQGNGAG